MIILILILCALVYKIFFHTPRGTDGTNPLVNIQVGGNATTATVTPAATPAANVTTNTTATVRGNTLTRNNVRPANNNSWWQRPVGCLFWAILFLVVCFLFTICGGLKYNMVGFFGGTDQAETYMYHDAIMIDKQFDLDTTKLNTAIIVASKPRNGFWADRHDERMEKAKHPKIVNHYYSGNGNSNNGNSSQSYDAQEEQRKLVEAYNKKVMSQGNQYQKQPVPQNYQPPSNY